MKTTRIKRGAIQRYFNALWQLYSKAEPIYNMNKVLAYNKICHQTSIILKDCNYVKKVNGQYVYTRTDAPTIEDAKFILQKLAERKAIHKKIVKQSKPIVNKLPLQSSISQLPKKYTNHKDEALKCHGCGNLFSPNSGHHTHYCSSQCGDKIRNNRKRLRRLELSTQLIKQIPNVWKYVAVGSWCITILTVVLYLLK